MHRRVGWLLSLVVGLTTLAPARGQAPPPPPAGEPSSAAVFPLVVAFVFTLVILLIVCMPSRKA